MSDEKTNQDKASAAQPGRGARKEVELFPVQADNKRVPQPQATASNVTRLGTQISIYNPVTFDEALDIVSSLRGRAATTISLDKMKKSDAGRLVDFVSGASAALDGDFHKLTDSVYIFCPSNIKIIAPVKPTATKTSSAGALDFLLSPELVSDKINAIGRKQ